MKIVKKCKKQQEFMMKGYTLIELMIAIGVFSIVLTLMSTSLITSLRGQEKSFTSQQVADSARYAMEIMTREIRMGINFPADGVTSSIQFTSTMPNRYNKTIKFYLDSGKIMFDDDLGDDAGSPDPTPPTAITSSNIVVSSLAFEISGNNSSSHPRIVIVMQTESTGTRADVQTTINLQTTVSPRRL